MQTMNTENDENGINTILGINILLVSWQKLKTGSFYVEYNTFVTKGIGVRALQEL